jgi:hypothetical protein
MSLRKMTLAGSWYPETEDEVSRAVSTWVGYNRNGGPRISAIVPHAGWYYSGKIAAETLSGVCRGRELIIVIGGHLPAGRPVLAAYEEELEIPGRRLVNRCDLITEIKKKIKVEEDVFQDNTVEVVLPLASYFAPDAEFLWLRAPSDLSSVKLAEELYRITSGSGINTAVIGSTDLTHYGSNYYFNPAGTGSSALKWVKEENDARIINEMLNMNPAGILNDADENKSACSSGAAAAAVEFARLSGIKKGRLVEYSTSYDVSPAESFVGYAGIRF